MKKKEVEGTFVAPKMYEFTAPELAVEETTAFSPVLPCKSKEKPEKNKKSATTKVIQRKISVRSIASSSRSSFIQPNYPKPIVRDQEIKKEKTVAEILFEYQAELHPEAMMPLKNTIKPNILLTIQQRPFSAGARTMDLYDKGKAKTIQEIRTQEKFKGRADAAVNVWMEKIHSETQKSNKIAERNVNRFKRSEEKLSGEISQLMNKIRATKIENDTALSALQSKISVSIASKGEADFSNFTKNGKLVKTSTNENTMEKMYETQVRVYNSNPSKEMPKIKPKIEEPASAISDDESFLRDISDPEDYEMLSDDEL